MAKWILQVAAASALVALTVEAQEAPTCKTYGRFTVVARERTDSLNMDVLVKDSPLTGKCGYHPAPGDYQLPNIFANKFILFIEPYLFLGGTSGPDGGTFQVYDVKARRKVFEHGFAGEGIKIQGDRVLFTDSLGLAKRSQCPKYDEIVRRSLSPWLVADVGFPLSDLGVPERLKSLRPGNQQCVQHQ